MRRQGQYGDPVANTYVGGGQMHHMSGQGIDNDKSVQFEGRLEAFTPERDNDPYANVEGQWRWDRDGSNLPNSIPSHMLNKGKCPPYSFSLIPVKLEPF